MHGVSSGDSSSLLRGVFAEPMFGVPTIPLVNPLFGPGVPGVGPAPLANPEAYGLGRLGSELGGEELTQTACHQCRQGQGIKAADLKGKEGMLGVSAARTAWSSAGGRFEADWAGAVIEGAYKGGTFSWRLFDRNGLVVGGTTNGYSLAARKLFVAGPGVVRGNASTYQWAEGWMRANDGHMTCVSLKINDANNAILLRRTVCRACPSSCSLYNVIALEWQAGPRPVAAPIAASQQEVVTGHLAPPPPSDGGGGGGGGGGTEAEAETNWLLYGGLAAGALVVIGGGLYFVKRRKK